MKQSKKKDSRFPIFQQRLRELQGEMTNTKFADFLGMSRQTVGFYLNGNRIPDIMGLEQIARICNVSTDWLLGLTNGKTPDLSLQGAIDCTGLSGLALDRVIRLAPQERKVLDYLLSHPRFRESFWLIERAKAMREAYEKYGHIEDDDDTNSSSEYYISLEEEIRQYLSEPIPYDLASELYIENAKTVFGSIANQYIAGAKSS